MEYRTKIFITICCLILSSSKDLRAQRLSRDLEIGLLTNHVGYLPASTKTCLVKGNEKRDFEVVEIISGRVVYRGELNAPRVILELMPQQTSASL